jgi:hypothetical protein
MRSSTLKVALLATSILNCFDCLLTLYWVDTSKAYELNPIMGSLVHNPLLFCLVKILLVSFGLSILWTYIENKVAQVSTIVAAVTYACIAGYHVWHIL